MTAVVVRSDPALDEKAVRAHCAANLVDYQRPHEFRFLAELPRNAMGKVLRREIRAQLEEPT